MEVFLGLETVFNQISCLLHVRGGVSEPSSTDTRPIRSSPRPWRCFHNHHFEVQAASVFSTSVEVFLRSGISRLKQIGLLHVRGGVSQSRTNCLITIIVFSTSVEVFLWRVLVSKSVMSLLHVRGGVSEIALVRLKRIKSSPRPWRCFYKQCGHRSTGRVFSTSVEVFLHKPRNCAYRGGLLHVRGGVSAFAAASFAYRASSPRPWRCFQRIPVVTCTSIVFSTSVEVFLRWGLNCCRYQCLLHVRGGVSRSMS